MDVLIEVHNEKELESALQVEAPLLGINNRNLHTFQTKIDTTLSLLKYIPKDKLIVTESGINTSDDIKLMLQHGVHIFLIGEAMMRETHPGKKLTEFLQINSTH